MVTGSARHVLYVGEVNECIITLLAMARNKMLILSQSNEKILNTAIETLLQFALRLSTAKKRTASHVY
jgi:hypothetical protein